MRYQTYGVGAALVFELEIAGAVKRILHDGRDIIHLELINNHSLMIHLIDSSIPVYEIRQTLARNTNDGHYTLFILWADLLLPDEGAVIPLEDWHEALLTLNGGKIYAYKVFMERLYIFPVYFDPIPYRTTRRIRYGDPLDVGGLQTHMLETSAEGINGTWRIAGFEGDPDAYFRQRAEEIGRPFESALQGYYDLLGVAPGTPMPQIKVAYRALARQYHPDLSGHEDSTAKMQEINRAYAVIIKALEAEE